MKKRGVFFAISCVILGLSVVPTVTAQGTGVPLLSRRNFNFNMAMYADGIKYTKNTYENQYLRRSVNEKDSQSFKFPFSGLDWLSDDSNISTGFETDWFGANYSFKRSNITNFGAVRGWVKFGWPDLYLKIIAGNDNDFTYADPLGADPGLRVYTGAVGNNWKDNVNPDNITQGNGIALNGVWNGLTLDLAASEFSLTPRKTQTVKPGTVAEYGDIEDKSFKYGGRIGCLLGDLGKVNASYFMDYNKVGTQYSWNPQTLELVAQAANAEVFNHYYGIFATLTPFDNFGATLGYSGVATKYLDEYFSVSGNMETTYPLILKHGVNLNFRYNGLLNGALRLRNDNSMTIFKDKNYSCFEVTGTATWGADYNTTSVGKNYAEIQHFFLWNGLGIEYDLKWFEGLMLSLYTRNLFRHDIATSNPNIVQQEYKVVRNEFFADLQVKYFFSDKAMVFAGLRMEYYTIFRSEDLNGQNPSFFINSMIMPREARETTDSRMSLSIPIGLILSW